MTAQLPWASGPDKAAGSGIGVPADFPGKIGDGTFRLAITSSSAIGRRGPSGGAAGFVPLWGECIGETQ